MKNRVITIASFFVLFLISLKVDGQKFEQPVLISSAGQSADVKLVKMLAQRQKLNATTVLMATADDLAGIKTLIIVPGFSSKGLGAAGVSQQEEFNRVKLLISKANEMKIPIVMVHIGGNARRKGQSDSFNKLVAENSKFMIIVKQADEDGFFTAISKAKSIPATLVESIANTEVPLGNLFN